MNISRQIKEISMQALYNDRSVTMAGICYSDPISTIPTNEQHLSEKRRGAKFQIDSLKTGDKFAYIKTDRRTLLRGYIQLEFLFCNLIVYLFIFVWFR